jgi:CHAT domain-containing protein/predicted negative regulator of RcsB-dependent stress response
MCLSIVRVSNSGVLKGESYFSEAMKNQRQLDRVAISFAKKVKLCSAALLATLLLIICSMIAIAAPGSRQSVGRKAASNKRAALAEKAEAKGEKLRAQWKAESLRMAARQYTEAQRYWRLTNQPRREAAVLKRLGDVNSLLSNYPLAIDYYNKAAQFARNVPDQQMEVDILNQSGNAYLEIANVKKAFPYCRRAQEISGQIGYQRGAAEALNCFGFANSISGDVMRAQENFNEALVIWQQVNYKEGLAYTLLNLGHLHANLGNTQLSIDSFNRALTLSQAVNDQQIQALTLTAMGGVYALQGEKQKAFNLHNQALILFRAIGNRSGEAATLNGIGYLYDDLGRKTKALKCYTLALQLYQSIENRNYAAITLGYIGRVHFALGDKEKALKFYNQKLSTSRAAQDRRMESYTLKDIGNVLSSTKDKDKALDYYKQALVLSEEVMDRRGEAYIINSIGSLYEQLGNQAQALNYYQQALPLMQAVAERRGEVITLFNIARAERDLERLADARSHIEKSLDLIEYLRTKVASPSLRISYLETVYQHYEFYIDLLMRMHRQNPAAGYERLALEANEHARARTLLENLVEARTDIRQGVDPELLAGENRIRQQLNQKAEQQTRMLSGKPTPEQASAIKKEVELLLAEYEEVESRVRDKSPRYAALTQPRQLRLSDIQKELDSETLLLEYSLGGERSYGWAVTATAITSFELPGRSEIEAAARELYRLLASGNARRKNESLSEQKARWAKSLADYPAAAARLSRILLEPVAPLLGRKRLVIVADGILQYTPFTALPEPGQAISDLASLQPLVVNHEVLTLPSLSTLAVLRQEVRGRPLAKKAVAVIADPVFERDDPRIKSSRHKVSIPLPANSGPSSEVSLRRRQLERAAEELETDDQPVTFQRLPFTLQEAEAILTIVPETETRRAIGFDANLKTALDPELRQYRVIHFATHGLLNNSYPELSGIVLSLRDKSGRPQDGFLRLNEIYNLDLPAELVVLSACQTGLGKEARGEGLIGLTRGFMYAGVARVVASLWRINDRSAAELMRYFYEAMFRQHLTPAAALRAAQIKMWQTGEWRFPHYWAAFVLEGEWN